MNVDPMGLHVSATISTSAQTPATLRRLDSTICRLFFSITTGAGSLLTALGFIATGNPLLLVSSIILGTIAITLLPGDSGHFRHRPSVVFAETYREPSYQASFIPVPIDQPSYIPVPIATGVSTSFYPKKRPKRSRSEVVVRYPAPPEYIAPVVHQQRAPVGARVRDVYDHAEPSAPPVYIPLPADSWQSAPPVVPPPFQAQDPRIVGSGATARAKIGRS